MINDKGLIINDKKPRDITERTFEFAVRVLKMTRYLSRNSTNNTLINQIVRSATSIGANIEEAQGAYTKSDFSHCMNISKKEARETFYWLKLIREMNLAIEKRLKPLLVENEEIIKILTTIVKNSNPRKFNS
jgi:four helix bundle protein